MLARADMIAVIEAQYFAAMDRKDLAGTLAPLTEDCCFTIYPAGTRLQGRDAGIREAFVQAFADYETLWHGNFNWVVDEPEQRVASWFDVRLVRPDGSRIEMNNGKFFHFRAGRLCRLDLYLSTTEPVVGDG